MGKEDFQEEEIVVDFAAEAVPLNEAQQNFYDPLKTGFLWYVPPLATETAHSTGGQEWKIVGHDMQILTMTVPPSSEIETEVGSFMFMSSGMETKVELTLCTKGGCSEGMNRIWGGENCTKLVLVNETAETGYVGLTPNFPAKVIPVKFGTHIAPGADIIAQPGAYMSHLGDVNVGCELDCGLKTCCCAGFGCCRQKMTASGDSIAFLAAGGTIMYRHLQDGETITVDTTSVVAFESTVKMGITPSGRLCTCLCGGEGLFSTTLTGPGRIYLQSYGFRRFVQAVQQTVMEDRDGGGADVNVS